MYDRGSTFVKSEIMNSRISDPYIEINFGDALTYNVANGDMVSLIVNGKEWELIARVSNDAPQGVVLIPRSMDGPMLRGVVPVNINTIDNGLKE